MLLIDIDSQANSSKVLLPHYQDIPIEETLHRTILEREPLAIHAANVPDVDIVPAHILLSNTDIELTTPWITGRRVVQAVRQGAGAV